LSVENLADDSERIFVGYGDTDFIITFGFDDQDISESDDEYVRCTPSHESGHTIHVVDHPADGWSGHYCRMEDWNGFPHFAKDNTHHWYYYELPGSYYCW
jgi:hypothetical protein